MVDEYGGKIEQNFTITLLNVVEDNDGDGTEDYYDPDDDNDGFTDEEELAYPSDPLDSQSVANTAPHHIGAPESISVTENVPLGTVVAEFQGEDVDADEVLGYSLVTGLGDDDNHLFTIDENGTLRTAKDIDYEESGQ